MSWLVQKTVGTPAAVRAELDTEFDRAARSYAGKPEGADVLAAKASVLAWLDSVPEGWGAVVEANGSRGDTWLSIKIECTTVRLKL